MTMDLAIFPQARAELRAFVGDIEGADLLPKHLKGKPADVYLTVMTGFELGLSPMQAIRSIHVIEGKPTMSADLMGALCMGRRDVCDYLRPVELSATVATYETRRVGWPDAMRLSFTMEDAVRAGLTGKDNWKRYPAAMLKSRALSAIVRAAYPDLMLGIYDPEELEPAEPIRVESRVIDATPREPGAGIKAKVGRKSAHTAPVVEAAAEVVVEAEAEPTADELRTRFATQLADMGAAPSDFRTFLIEAKGKDAPPVAQWDAARLSWAVKALDSGIGAEFRAYLAAGNMDEDGDDGGQPDLI